MANIPSELRALPLEFIVAAPLTAAIKAQAMAAKTTIDFIKEVGLKEDTTGTSVDDNKGYEARYVEFKFDRVLEERTEPATADGQPTVKHSIVPSKLTVPLLSIVPIPFIRINDMTIDFEYKISDVQTSESTTEKNVTAEVKAKAWFASTTIKGSYTNKNTNKRQTDTSSTLRITVNALQDVMPEGLSRVLDILHESTKVVPLTAPQEIAAPHA
jgi:hypothetical protein